MGALGLRGLSPVHRGLEQAQTQDVEKTPGKELGRASLGLQSWHRRHFQQEGRPGKEARRGEEQRECSRKEEAVSRGAGQEPRAEPLPAGCRVGAFPVECCGGQAQCPGHGNTEGERSRPLPAARNALVPAGPARGGRSWWGQLGPCQLGAQCGPSSRRTQKRYAGEPCCTEPAPRALSPPPEVPS